MKILKALVLLTCQIVASTSVNEIDTNTQPSAHSVIKLPEEKKPYIRVDLPKIKDIATYLTERTKGQDDAMYELARVGFQIKKQMELYKKDPTAKFSMPHTFIGGPSGSGKTSSVQHLCDYLKIPYVKASATSIVPEGIKGIRLSALYGFDQIREQIDEDDENEKHICFAIIVLDELGKCAAKNSNLTNVYGPRLIQDLLTHMDGIDVNLSSEDGTTLEKTFSTQGFTYIGTDACYEIPKGTKINEQSLTEHLMMMPEFVNRLRRIIELKDHTEDSYLQILRDSHSSPYSMEKNAMMKLFNCNFVVALGGLNQIAKFSFSKNKGVRGLEDMITRLAEDVYDDLESYLVNDLPPCDLAQASKNSLPYAYISESYVSKFLQPLRDAIKDRADVEKSYQSIYS